MITLSIKSDFLFQIHKNHLKNKVLTDCVLKFTGVGNKKTIEVTAYVLKEYYNFYLFTIDTFGFDKLDSSAELEIVSPTNEVIFQSDIKIK